MTVHTTKPLDFFFYFFFFSVKMMGWAGSDVKCSDRLMGQFVAHHFHVRGRVGVQVSRQVTLGAPSREAAQRPWRICQRNSRCHQFLEGVSGLNIEYPWGSYKISSAENKLNIPFAALGRFRRVRVALKRVPRYFSDIGHLEISTGTWRGKAKISAKQLFLHFSTEQLWAEFEKLVKVIFYLFFSPFLSSKEARPI